MTASFIGHYTYNDFCRKIKFPDYDLTVEKIIDLCEFLDGKQFDDNGKIIKNVLDDFLYQIIRKSSFDPEYPEVIMEFIKTDYYSDRVKKDIYKMTKNLEGYEKANKRAFKISRRQRRFNYDNGVYYAPSRYDG